MKFLSRLILMCLTLELIVAPIKPEMAMITILKANAAASDCTAGMTWSDSANRCLVNASTAQTQRDLEDCAKSSDPKSCYEKNAEKAANVKGSKLASGDIQAMYKGNSAGLNIAKTTVYALPLMFFGYLMTQKKMFGKDKCLPPSTIAMLVASVAMLGGEVYGFIKHKSNLKKLDKARQDLFNPASTDNLDQKKVDATKMQSEAFQLLSDEQKSVEELAKTKETFYAVAMSAYAAAAGIAAYELIAIKMAKNSLIKIASQESVSLTANKDSRGVQVASLTAQLGAKEAAKLSEEAAQLVQVKKAGANSEMTAAPTATDLAATLNQLVALQTPQTSPAASKYSNLLARYECWGRGSAPQNSIDRNKIEKTLENLNPNDIIDTPIKQNNSPSNSQINQRNVNIPIFKKQLQLIKDANSLEDVLALSIELEEMIKGNQFSSLTSQLNTKSVINTKTDKIFVNIFAEITAAQLEEKYSLGDTKKPSIDLASIFTTIQSQLGISKAHANASMLLAILPTAGMLLMSSNIFKKKDPSKSSSGSQTTDGSTASNSSGENESFLNDKKQTEGKMNKFLQTPKFRIAFGAVLGTLTAFMVKEMNDQKKTAKARKETLLSLKADFENTQGMRICTPDERNDQTQPGCYCYTSEGTRNTARASSAVCQNMWSTVNLNGTSYLADAGDGTKVCITQSNQVDESCSCRTSGTCLKASGFNISGISLGTLSTLGSGLSPINTLASGNGANLSTEGIVSGAFKLRDATDKILASNDFKNDNAIVKAAEKSLENFVNANQGSIGSPSARSTPSSLAGFDAKAALEDLQKEVESTKASTASTGTGFDMGQPSEPSLEFGLTEEEAAIQEQQVAEVLNQDMDLGNNDISTSNSNIFELLTHRYQRSGMRRLFDTEGKTQPDAPAETDVNK